MNPGRTALIMMVDDRPANLSVLSELLCACGFKISVAEDGESALEQLQYVQPDLILLDVLMPHLDGFTTCRWLKERPKTQDIPVIFMTALTDTVEKVKGFKLGAVDYITKLFQQEEVLARVSTHSALQQLKARLKESEARLRAHHRQRHGRDHRGRRCRPHPPLQLRRRAGVPLARAKSPRPTNS